MDLCQKDQIWHNHENVIEDYALIKLLDKGATI